MIGTTEETFPLITMSGYDDTYQAEARAFTSTFPRDIFPNQEFLQAIKMGANGKPYIDWVAFHQVKSLRSRMIAPSTSSIGMT